MSRVRKKEESRVGKQGPGGMDPFETYMMTMANLQDRLRHKHFPTRSKDKDNANESASKNCVDSGYLKTTSETKKGKVANVPKERAPQEKVVKPVHEKKRSPLEACLYSDLIKPALTTDLNPEIHFTNHYYGPYLQTKPKSDLVKIAGYTPCTTRFHLRSNRVRRDDFDDGLDDDDLTAADGIVRKIKKEEKPSKKKRSKKRSIGGDIKLVKGEFAFAFKTYRPKCQNPFRAGPGQISQNVQVERLHRLYKKTDINFVLESLGVELDDLIVPPNYGESNVRFYQEMMFRNRVTVNGVEKREFLGKGHHRDNRHSVEEENVNPIPPSSSSSDSLKADVIVSRGKEHPFLKAKPPFGFTFPLHAFDNSDFDIRSPKEWMNLGRDPQNKMWNPLPAKALLPFSNQNRQGKPAVSTSTYDRLLKRNDELLNFRRWLIKERYQYLLKMGKERIGSLTRLEVQRLSQAQGSQILQFASSRSSFGKSSGVNSKTSLSALSIKKLFGQDIPDDISDTEEVSEEMSEVQSQSSESISESLSPHLSMVVGDSRLELPQRSDSILSDIFSDVESMAQIQSEFLLHAVTDGLHDTDNVIDGASTKLKMQMTKGSIGDYGDIVPTSPDIDPYEDGSDVIFDYDQMKKTHVYDWKWVEVAVLWYDPTSDKFLVRSIYAPVVYAWVHKLYLCFDAEDPIRQGARIKDAVVRRIEAENTMRFNLYVDSLPLTIFPPVPEEIVQRIQGKVWNLKKSGPIPEEVKAILREVNLQYQRTNAHHKFLHVIGKHHKLFRPWVRIPEPDTVWDSSQTWGKQRDYHTDKKKIFSYKVKKIQKLSVIHAPVPFKVLRRIHNLCLEASVRPLILTEFEEPIHIEDYEKAQVENIQKVMTFLQEDWFHSILHTIRSEFGKIPKSWYNMTETRWDVFRLSKLYNFLTLIQYMMQDTLRYIVQDSLLALVQQVTALTADCENRKSFDWTDNLTVSQYPTPTGLKPLFIVDMTMDEYGEPRFTHPLHTFLTVANRIYDLVISSSKSISNIFPPLFPQFIFSSDTRHMTTVHKSEEQLAHWAFLLNSSLRNGLMPVDSYAQKFQRYKQLWVLDIPQFVNSFEKENNTTAATRKTIDQHVKHMKQLESEIPTEMRISAFQVIIKVVKEGLVSKKKSLYTALLDGFAAKLKGKVNKIMDEYKDIEEKLDRRSEDIKEVVELKNYAESIPTYVMDNLQQMMMQVLKDYDVFDKFRYRVSNEDSEFKWNGVVTSYTIVKLAQETITALEDDYEQLLKIQQAEAIVIAKMQQH